MADLYNLDAELEEGMLGTEDTQLVNTAISTDEDNNNNNRNDPMEIDDTAYEETSDYQPMSNVPVALREAAMARQRMRRGGDESNNEDDHEDDDVDAVNGNKQSKDIWDSSKTDSYLLDSTQQQQQEEKRNYQKQLQNLPYTHLYQAWAQECRAPDLLPYPYDTIQQIRDGLLRYENYSCMMNQEQGEDNHRHRSRHETNENLNALMDSLLRIDAERVKFLLSDLLKRRIQKITLHPQHYTKLLLDDQHPHEGDEMNEKDDKLEQHPLMCGPEITLLKNYMTMVKQHLSTTVTDHFPQEAWRTLDIPNDSVHEPNVQNQFVFIRCLENVTIPDSTTPMDEDDSEQIDHDTIKPIPNFSQGGQLHQAGMSLIVRYERIRHLLLQGKVELI